MHVHVLLLLCRSVFSSFVGFEIRGVAQFNRMTHHSMDTTFFNHATLASAILEQLPGTDNKTGATQRILAAVEVPNIDVRAGSDVRHVPKAMAGSAAD